MRVIAAVSRQSDLSHSYNWPRSRNLSNRWRETESVVNNQNGTGKRLSITRLQLVRMRITTRGDQTSNSRRITHKSCSEITQRSINSDDVCLESVGRTLAKTQDEKC